jgi:hypothetical protein
LKEVAGDLAGDAVGAGLLGGELFGLFEVVEGVADLAARGVGGGEVDVVAGLPLGRQPGDVDVVGQVECLPGVAEVDGDGDGYWLPS